MSKLKSTLATVIALVIFFSSATIATSNPACEAGFDACLNANRYDMYTEYQLWASWNQACGVSYAACIGYN